MYDGAAKLAHYQQAEQAPSIAQAGRTDDWGVQQWAISVDTSEEANIPHRPPYATPMPYWYHEGHPKETDRRLIIESIMV